MRMSFIATSRPERYRVRPLFFLLILLLWVALSYGSIETYAMRGRLDIFQKIFNNPLFKVSLFDLIAITVATYIVLIFHKEKKGSKLIAFFFSLTTITTLICLFNPHNNLTFFQYFYGPPLVLYLLIFFSYSILTVSHEEFTALYDVILKVGFAVLLFHSIEVLLRFSLGSGMSFLDMPSSIPYMDVLLFIAAFQTIALGRYLNTKKRLNLVWFIIFNAVLLLSYRRSALILGVASDLFLLMYYLFIWWQKKEISLRALFFPIATILLVGLTLSIVAPRQLRDLSLRQFGVFSEFSDSPELVGHYSDSGHLTQSIQTSLVFLEDFSGLFWGAGFGNRPYFVYGQAPDSPSTLGGIHNSFVLAWAEYGLHMTLYIILMTATTLYIIIKMGKNKCGDFVLVGTVAYLFLLLIGGWANGVLLVHSSHYVVFFVILFSSVKLVLRTEAKQVVQFSGSSPRLARAKHPRWKSGEKVSFPFRSSSRF